MSFAPPRCPNPDCDNHRNPKPEFFRLRGHYEANRHQGRQQRYQCRACGRSFSRQTFCFDRGDQRPELNVMVASRLVSGTGLRQTARELGLNLYAVQQKLQKLGLQAKKLHANLAKQLPPGKVYLFDEEETYEARAICPLTVPILMERASWFMVSTAVGSIRRLAVAGSNRRRKQEALEANHGTRPDESREKVREVLDSLAARATEGRLAFQTDEKSSYRTLIKEVFGDRATHTTTPGSAARTKANPLFPINTTITMLRDNLGRLRRKSWLVTKRAKYLRLHLHLFTAYRNYVRKRFNRDRSGVTSATNLGIIERALTWAEVLGWRQDWAEVSPHPTSTLAAVTT